MRLLSQLKSLSQEKNVLEESLPILKKECSQILKEMRKGYFVLYRGFKNVEIGDDGEKSQFFSRVPRKGRQPLDTSTTMHLIMDDYFDKKFGWRARSEGVFCTTSPSHAKFYGEIYMVFPVNGFKFIYSPNVHDLFDEQNRFIKKFTKNKISLLSDLHTFLDMAKANKVETEEAVFKMLDGLKYTDKSLRKAKTNNSEVMIKCSKYYALSNKLSLGDILLAK